MIALLLAALLVVSARPASARVTVSVQWTYGTVLAGGVGLYVVFAASWYLPLHAGMPAPALLEFRPGGLRWGLPILMPLAAPDGEAPRGFFNGFRADLIRVSF